MNFLKQEKLWKEFINDSKNIDLKSLTPRDNLNPKVWDSEQEIKPEILKILLDISTKFFDNLNLDLNIEDIILTGSLASYNWSRYSDFDLHILVKFNQVDENIDLVRDYFGGKTFIWNTKHNIFINDHEVELYVQDVDEPHHALGVFSIKNNKWLSKPSKYESEIDFKAVENKALNLMDCINRVEMLFDDKEYKEAHECGLKIKEKIKKMRKSGLDSDGIFSVENLSFKILRRNKYLEILNNLINKSYDRLQSLSTNFVKKLNIFVSKQQNTDINEFVYLQEEEKFQKLMKIRHKRNKPANISHGNQPAGPPYTQKASNKRSKSAPPGAGGV